MLNRLTHETYADGSTINFTYTPAGRRHRAGRSGRDDLWLRYARATDQGRQPRRVGNRLYLRRQREPDLDQNPGRDDDVHLRLPESARDRQGSAGGITRYTYDADGERTKTDLPNGTSEVRTYDTRGLLLTQVLTGNSVVLASETYTYDAYGNQTSVTEQSGRVVHYTYDKLNRVTQEAIIDPTAVDGVIDYAYDAVGNLLTKKDSVGGQTTNVYDANDELTQATGPTGMTKFTYDANGNMLSRVTSAVDEVLYHWNPRGLLATADITTPGGTNHVVDSYDADGNRVSEVVNGVETRSLVDITSPFAQVVEQYAADGTVLASYVFGAGPVSQTRAGQQRFYVTDAIGSVRALTDPTGAVSDRYTYDAFGSLLQHAGTATSTLLYAGQWFDPATGLINLRARQYDPALGASSPSTRRSPTPPTRSRSTATSTLAITPSTALTPAANTTSTISPRRSRSQASLPLSVVSSRSGCDCVLPPARRLL